MNIFVTDESPQKAANNLDDKRVVKMILETTQLLCTAVNLNGGKSPYKSTHVNHPSSVWARQSNTNYTWLRHHGIQLCIRYTEIYERSHKCFPMLLDLADGEKHIPTGDLTPFANCTTNKEKGINYKHIENTVDAYRLYLVNRWNTDKKKPTWRGFDPKVATKLSMMYPEWLTIDNNGLFLYKGKEYKTLFGGYNENNKNANTGVNSYVTAE